MSLNTVSNNNRSFILRSWLLPVFIFAAGVVYAQDAGTVYKNCVNSTVTIITDKSVGSGFFISEDALVTNYHVIDGALKVSFVSPVSGIKIEIDSFFVLDEANDLAILKVSVMKGPPIRLSAEKPVPGSRVYVIGSPKGLEATISEGIISGLREWDGISLIQISAPISPGSSGGPVLNNGSELVGVAVAQIREGQNLNFCIPSETVKKCFDSMPPQAKPIEGLVTASLKDGRYRLVNSLMEAMMKFPMTFDATFYISPVQMEKNKKLELYSFNHFRIGGYKIESQKEGLFTVLIWGENRTWVHRLHFRVEESEGKHYFVCGKAYKKVKMIDPWVKEEKFLPLNLIPRG